MNQDPQNDKLRELFLELKQEDERRAPSFGQVWEAALSHWRKARWRSYRLRVAAAAAMLVALGFVLALLFTQQSAPRAVPALASPALEPSSRSRRDNEGDMSKSKIRNLSEPPRSPSRRPKSEMKVPLLASAATVYESQPSSLPWPSALLISQWRAPTDFLLSSPGEELWKEIPRSSPSQTDLPVNLPIEKK